MAVEETKRMVAMGWLDGSAVQMLSTADGTMVSTVTHRIGAAKNEVAAPVMVHRYNRAMQAVDRHDQLRVKFSLCSKHHFKKWYVKFMLALIDIAMTNASIHYFFANPGERRREHHRATFLDELAEAMLSDVNWDAVKGRTQLQIFEDDMRPESTTALLHDLAETMSSRIQRRFQDTVIGSYGGSTTCLPMDILAVTTKRSIYGRVCQVCTYEERGDRWKTVTVCRSHSIRLCHNTWPDRSTQEPTLMRSDNDGEPVTDFSWLCPDSTLTCWQKFHNYYGPRNYTR